MKRSIEQLTSAERDVLNVIKAKLGYVSIAYIVSHLHKKMRPYGYSEWDVCDALDILFTRGFIETRYEPFDDFENTNYFVRYIEE